MMLSVPALTTSLPGKLRGKRVVQEDVRPEVKMGITQYYISISSRLITEPEAERQERSPGGLPQEADGWEGSGLGAPSHRAFSALPAPWLLLLPEAKIKS